MPGGIELADAIIRGRRAAERAYDRWTAPTRYQHADSTRALSFRSCQSWLLHINFSTAAGIPPVTGCLVPIHPIRHRSWTSVS